MRCRLVLREVISYAAEHPDVIGWRWGSSILVECKTSRADFARDRLKPYHQHDTGMGEKRFFLTPPGLLKAEELPDGWGLLEAHPKAVRVVREATPRSLLPHCYRDELLHCIRGIRMLNGHDDYPTKKSESILGPDDDAERMERNVPMAIQMMRNTVLLRRCEPDTTSKGGIIIPLAAQRSSTQAVVVAVGPGKHTDHGFFLETTVKPGNTVVIGKWEGADVMVDGEKLLIVPEDFVLAIIDPVST